MRGRGWEKGELETMTEEFSSTPETAGNRKEGLNLSGNVKFDSRF